MKPLHILWLCSSPSNAKPTLFIADHINIGLGPFEYLREQRRLAHPLRDLRPKNIVQLLFCRSCRYDTRIRKAGDKPQEHSGLQTGLTNTLARFDTDLRVVRQVHCRLCLPFIRFKLQYFPEINDRIISPYRYAFIKEVRQPIHITVHSVPSLTL